MPRKSEPFDGEWEELDQRNIEEHEHLQHSGTEAERQQREIDTPLTETIDAGTTADDPIVYKDGQAWENLDPAQLKEASRREDDGMRTEEELEAAELLAQAEKGPERLEEMDRMFEPTMKRVKEKRDRKREEKKKAKEEKARKEEEEKQRRDGSKCVVL